MSSSPYWSAPPLWLGETAFIVGGGTSVATQNLDLLRGRKVVVINSSCYALPWADVLFFGDSRWYRENRKAVETFAGVVVTCAPVADAKLHRMRKVAPPGLTDERDALTMRRTSLTAAINLVVHFGTANIVLLGADGRAGKGNRTHHHGPHPWPQRPDCWEQQRKDIDSTVKPLKKRGITVLNASPGSALPFWPVMSLEEALCRLDSASSATSQAIERNSLSMG